MAEEKHIYRARLDFLYQSIAVYAVTLVVYLIIGSIGEWEVFPSVWQDPLLMLLCAITLLSVIALLYNLFMRRQIEINSDSINFTSRARSRRISREDVSSIQIGPRHRRVRRVRAVRIRLKSDRRPIRIRLGNFERSRKLLEDIRSWGGPLSVPSQKV